MQANSTKRTLALLAGVVFSTLTGLGASAQTNQLVFSPGDIFRFGDTRDMDCTVQMNITGSLASKASAITDIRIYRAVDDKGKDLTKRAVGLPQPSVSPFGKHSGRVFNQSGWLAVLKLKCPGKSAKQIREITGEIDLALPTVENGGVLKVTNFMAKPGQVIDSANLARHGIKLTFHTLESYTDFSRTNPKEYVDPTDLEIERNCFSGIYGSLTNPPRTSVAIQVDDPNKLLLGLSFETKDGQQVQTVGSYSVPGFRCYKFAQPPSPEMNLVVALAVPGVIRTEPFSMRDIWLPWDRSPGSPYLDPPDLRTTAELQVRERQRWTNSTLNLTFIGGPIANADGIRRVTLLRATDETGNPVHLPSPATGQNYSTVETWKAPKRAWRSLYLNAPPSVKRLKFLEGEVEVFQPNPTNGGVLVFTNLLSFSGKQLPLPAEAAQTTKVHFVGLTDFRKQEAGLTNAETGWSSTGGPINNPTNTLLFEIENPETYLLRMTFRGSDGCEIFPARTLHSGKYVVYNFREAPRADLQLVVYLAAPAALQMLRFRAENVPVGVNDF